MSTVEQFQLGIDPRIQRSLGFIHKGEFRATEGKVVAVAGLGGDGHRYANLPRMFPHLKAIKGADPETIAEQNINRVDYADETTIGCMKVDLFEAKVKSIQSGIEVHKFPDGITHDNVEEFVEGSDLVIDEIELLDPSVAIALHRAARRRGIAVLTTMNIGFMGVGTSFHPDGKTYEDMLGIPKGMPLDEIKDFEVPISRLLPKIPWKYGDIEALAAVEQGAPLPSILPGVDQAAAIGMTEAFLHLTRDFPNQRKQPTWAPKWKYLDSYTAEAGIIKPSSVKFYGAVALGALRSKLGINPKASYSLSPAEK